MTGLRTEGLGSRLSRLLAMVAGGSAGALLAGPVGAFIGAVLGLLGFELLSRPIAARILRAYLKNPLGSRPPPAEPFPGAAALLGFCLAFDSAPGSEGQAPGRRLNTRERLGVLMGLLSAEGLAEDSLGLTMEELWEMAREGGEGLDPAPLAKASALLSGSWRLTASLALALARSSGAGQVALERVSSWMEGMGCKTEDWKAAQAAAEGSDPGQKAQEAAIPLSSTRLTRAPREVRRSIKRS